ncbi:HAD family hydrolase [Nonomuraea helvata]|uniref:HAD family hydrolase n=1 Tax=Nonomuraea helvata TaxID=37484 RepID=A0ABV5S4P3_9ACTN
MLFDLDNTLIDRLGAFRLWAAEFAAQRGLGEEAVPWMVDRVDGWAISGAEGVRKPDVRLFEIAARRCGASLHSGGWVVGDDPGKDIAGGRDAGLRTIWIDRGVTGGVVADHTVSDARSAIELLIQLN